MEVKKLNLTIEYTEGQLCGVKTNTNIKDENIVIAMLSAGCICMARNHSKHPREFITALTIANMEFVNKPPVYTNVEKDLS